MYAKVNQNSQLYEKILLWFSVVATLGLLQLPYEKVDGNAVLPTIIFKDKPSYFRAFVLSLNFSFFGSFMAITLREHYQRTARSFFLLAVASLIVGIGILTWLIMPEAAFSGVSSDDFPMQ